MRHTRWTNSSIEERFFDKVDKSGTCWLWTGASDRKGYGTLRIDGRAAKAHRLGWEFANGPIPEGMFVCHRCDVPACVNPSHLFLGTQKDNMSDCSAKGRTNPRRKLTPEQVAAIKKLHGDGMLQRAIAELFGVAQPTVSKIILGQRWASQ